MKFKTLFFSLFVAVMAVSCGQKSPKELIAKVWVVDNMEVTEAGMSEIPKESHEEFKKIMDEMIAKVKGKATYDFKADGKVAIKMVGFSDKEETKEGTWTISEDGKKVTIDIDQNKKDLDVKTLTDNEFNFEMDKMIWKLAAKK